MNNDDTLWVLEHKIRRIDTDDSNGIVEIHCRLICMDRRRIFIHKEEREFFSSSMARWMS